MKYNDDEQPPKEVEVTISLTISKPFTVKVTDYTEEYDAGYHGTDYTDCDLKKAVQDQITLPVDLSYFVKSIFDKDLDLKAAGMPKYLQDALKDCDNWYIDDFEVTLE